MVPVGVITMVFSRPLIEKVYTAYQTNSLSYSDTLISFGNNIAILVIIAIANSILGRIGALQNTTLRMVSQILLGAAAGLTGITVYLILFTFFVSL